MPGRTFTAGIAAAALLLAGTTAQAAIEIQWWHAMTGGNNEVIVKLAEEFNTSQQDYKVVQDPLKIVDGHAVVSGRPGSGVVWDAKAVERYRV